MAWRRKGRGRRVEVGRDKWLVKGAQKKEDLPRDTNCQLKQTLRCPFERVGPQDGGFLSVLAAPATVVGWWIV